MCSTSNVLNTYVIEGNMSAWKNVAATLRVSYSNNVVSHGLHALVFMVLANYSIGVCGLIKAEWCGHKAHWVNASTQTMKMTWNDTSNAVMITWGLSLSRNMTNPGRHPWSCVCVRVYTGISLGTQLISIVTRWPTVLDVCQWLYFYIVPYQKMICHHAWVIHCTLWFGPSCLEWEPWYVRYKHTCA